MNAGGEWRGHIERMYWGVSPAVLEGIVGQVRTALINLVAEITAHMPEGVEYAVARSCHERGQLPGDERAPQDQLFSASGRTALAARPPEEHPRRWLRTAAAIIIGVATIVGVFIALMETQGWSF